MSTVIIRSTARVAPMALALSLLTAANAQVTFYGTQAAFTAAASVGRTMTGFENFEASTQGAGSVVSANDPLNAATNDAYYSTGSIVPGLSVQSNLGGAGSGSVAPRGAGGLAYVSVGSGGASSDVVVADYFVDSLDLIFSVGGLTAVGFNTNEFLGGGSLRIDVYDTANALIGALASTPADAAGTSFLGMTSVADIGRVNIFSTGGGAQGGDNIEMWTVVPEPATLAALGLGALALIRRKARR